MIPKLIHYIWFGGEMPTKILRNIELCKKINPDYEIKIWNEKNFLIDSQYPNEMYKKKLYAFVSDYVRFSVLKQYGGVYLDTDMQVLKNFDVLLNNQTFFGKTKDGFVACGIIGAVPEAEIICDALNYYDRTLDFSTYYTSPRIITELISSNKYDNVKIYSSDYFYPCDDGEKLDPQKTANAFTNHLWYESWVTFAWLRKILRRIGVMVYLKSIWKKFQ